MNPIRPFPKQTFVAITPLLKKSVPKPKEEFTYNQRIKEIYGISPYMHVGPSGTIFIFQKPKDDETDLIRAFDSGHVLLNQKGYVETKVIDNHAVEFFFDSTKKNGSISVHKIFHPDIYFSLRDSLFFWGTDPGLVATLSSANPILFDQDYLWTFFIDGAFVTTSSPFQNIYKVPYGSSLRFSLTGTEFCPINNIFAPLEIKDNNSNNNWKHKCFQLINDSIRDSIGDTKRVGIMVSGGLDSSLLFHIADHSYRGEVSFIPIFLDYQGSATANERIFFQALSTDNRNRIIVNMDKALCPNGDAMPEDIPLYPEPHRELLMGRVWLKVRQALAMHNVSLVLSGYGGDQLFMSQVCCPLHLISRLFFKNPLNWIEELYKWSAMNGFTCWKALRLLMAELMGSIPKLGQTFLRHKLRSFHISNDDKDGWLIPLLEQVSPIRRLQAFSFLHSSLSCERALYFPSINIQYPYTQQKLIRFCLQVPLDQHIRSGWDRYLERSIAESIGLSSIITWRNSKGGLIEPFIRSCRVHLPNLTSFTENSIAVKFGLLMRDELQELFWKTLAGDLDSAHKFFNFYLLEAWLRTRPELSK